MNNKIVFILGAGTSMEYGLPSGFQLMQQIRDDIKVAFSKEKDLWMRYAVEKALNNELEPLKAFLNGMDYADSIDQLLQAHTKVRKFIKILIARRILEAESKVKFNHTIDHWLKYLWNFINIPEEGNLRGNIHILTFNYDRILEFYLISAIKNFYNLDDVYTLKLLQNITIKHLYGSLGNNNILEEFGNINKHTDSDSLYYNHLYNLSNNIRIINESKPDFQEREHIQSIFEYAEAVFSLGFGFHTSNSNLLFNENTDHKFKASGTAYGLGESRIAEIQTDYQQNYQIQISLYNKNNLDFFKNNIYSKHFELMK